MRDFLRLRNMIRLPATLTFLRDRSMVKVDQEEFTLN